MTEAVNKLAHGAREEAQAYQNGEPRPLGGYVLTMTVFAALVSGAAGIAKVCGKRLPADWSTRDLVLLAAGTHKLSRILSKDAVTSPLRAPMTRYQDTAGPAEVMEDVRNAGQLRHALGELVTCPFCLDLWVATGFAFGIVFAPRFTRLVMGTFASISGADFLQLAYARAQQEA